MLSHNSDYIDILNKEILASQLIVRVYAISYGSINFNISCEPFEKLIKLFENNFEFMRIFFESYIPQIFIEAISDGETSPYSDVSIVASCQIPENYDVGFRSDKKNEQNEKSNKENSSIAAANHSMPAFNNNIDKMRWLAGLISSPMLFPFLLALTILYLAYQKLDNMNASYQRQNELLLKQKDVIIDEYKTLLNISKTPEKSK